MKPTTKKSLKIRQLATKDLLAASGGGNFIRNGYFSVVCPNCFDEDYWEGGDWQTCRCCGGRYEVGRP